MTRGGESLRTGRERGNRKGLDPVIFGVFRTATKNWVLHNTQAALFFAASPSANNVKKHRALFPTLPLPREARGWARQQSARGVTPPRELPAPPRRRRRFEWKRKTLIVSSSTLMR